MKMTIEISMEEVKEFFSDYDGHSTKKPMLVIHRYIDKHPRPCPKCNNISDPERICFEREYDLVYTSFDVIKIEP